MAEVTFDLVELDSAPNPQFTVKRDGAVVDLTNPSVSTVELNIHSTVTGQNTNTPSTNDCIITTPASGVVTYNLAASDIPHPGVYLCDLVLNYANGEIETQPDYVIFYVRPKVGSIS